MPFAIDIELAVLQIFFRDRREHVELQFPLVSFFDLSETANYDKVHAVKELHALTEHAQTNDLSKPIHLVTCHCIVHYGKSSDNSADEKLRKVAELGYFICPCVPQSDMLKHDSHVHCRI